jgi:hypothetical protein
MTSGISLTVSINPACGSWRALHRRFVAHGFQPVERAQRALVPERTAQDSPPPSLALHSFIVRRSLIARGSLADAKQNRSDIGFVSSI